MKKQLPEVAQEVINNYKNLPLGKEGVVCPYAKNFKGVRGGLRVMLGKGSPQEIAEEVILLAKQRRCDLAEKSPQEIREFMESRGLGIDCSGLVVHVLAAANPAILKQVSARSFWKSPLRFFIAKLRPVENISVKVLTNKKNSERIADLNAIEVGDMIRTRNGDHILLVTEIEKAETSVSKISYTHSTSFYGDAHGVRTSAIAITKPTEPLEKQAWDEVDETGKNFSLEGYIEGKEDSGIFRLNSTT